MVELMEIVDQERNWHLFFVLNSGSDHSRIEIIDESSAEFGLAREILISPEDCEDISLSKGFNVHMNLAD